MRIYLVNAESGKGYRAGLLEGGHPFVLESFVMSAASGCQPLAFKPVELEYLGNANGKDASGLGVAGGDPGC